VQALRVFLLALLLSGCVGTDGRADAWRALAPAEGVYRGLAASGGMLVPVTTRFSVAGDGTLQGSYTFLQDGLAHEGTLSHGRAEGPRAAVFIWHDAWGFGTIEVTFSDDFKAFTAIWAPLDDGYTAFPWIGERQALDG